MTRDDVGDLEKAIGHAERELELANEKLRLTEIARDEWQAAADKADRQRDELQSTLGDACNKLGDAKYIAEHNFKEAEQAKAKLSEANVKLAEMSNLVSKMADLESQPTVSEGSRIFAGFNDQRYLDIEPIATAHHDDVLRILANAMSKRALPGGKHYALQCQVSINSKTGMIMARLWHQLDAGDACNV